MVFRKTENGSKAKDHDNERFADASCAKGGKMSAKVK